MIDSVPAQIMCVFSHLIAQNNNAMTILSMTHSMISRVNFKSLLIFINLGAEPLAMDTAPFLTFYRWSFYTATSSQLIIRL